jgi:hypothetical protein
MMRGSISILDMRRFIRWMVALAGPDYSSQLVRHRQSSKAVDSSVHVLRWADGLESPVNPF